MFVKINSHQNFVEYYAYKELIGQIDQAYKVIQTERLTKNYYKKHTFQSILSFHNQLKILEIYQDDNSYNLISEYREGQTLFVVEGRELFVKIKIAQILTEKEFGIQFKQILSAHHEYQNTKQLLLLNYKKIQNHLIFINYETQKLKTMKNQEKILELY
ncbi:unnamed protein product [Paramecium sonneborni]|uniref:Uncharacterized protein n=1 Tax=Paramecium sonneborni TaxID=65129 RepID=A0A8S1QSV4_9CILI|nr:unnamed protein product [Paramecium sonneborni]